MYDLRRALRALRKEPLFAAVAIATLALGIGANTAIFSVVEAVLLDRVAYPADEPEEVLVLAETAHLTDEMGIAYPSFKDWQRMNRSFEALAGFRETEANLTGVEEPLRLSLTQVSYGYFHILGVSPLLGRFFSSEEDQPGAERVLVLNHALWRNQFGGDRNVVGQVATLDENPYTIIGVLPDDFELSPEERAYTTLEPWADSENTRDRGNHMDLFALARLAEGVGFEEARTEMETIARRLEAEYPESNSGVGVHLERLSSRRVKEYRRTLWTLLGATSLVLLIACANVANLLLARAVGRKRAAAIQAALGASRLRLVRQGLTEGLVLAVLGGALGALLAYWSLQLLKGALPVDIPRIDRVAIDLRILLYTLGVSLSTSLFFGSFPAWVLSRSRPSDPMKEGGRDTGQAGVAGRGLLVAEVALATVLLVGASLLIRTVYELTQVNPGFRADHLLTMRVGVPYARYEGNSQRAFLDRLDEELEAVPGVRSATFGLVLPLNGVQWSSVFIVGDLPVPPRAELPSSIFTPVQPGYFETLAIPLLRGRLLDATDDGSGAPRVVVVNERLANHFWPGQDPIGKRLKQGWPENEGEFHPWREIVGVVADVNQFGLGEETMMQTYVPLRGSIWNVQLALRTETDPLTLVEPVREAIRRLDASLPVYDVETMEAKIGSSIAPQRFAMLLLGIFAALALALAAVGLYGVIAYSVARRTREIGLRMSVGAARSDIFGLVVRQGMIWAVLGAAIGLAASAAASRVLASFLFGVTERDPLTFAVVPLVLLAVAFAASAAPALTASRIDPIRALRYE
jgi:putative ABC transport system permease protein